MSEKENIEVPAALSTKKNTLPYGSSNHLKKPAIPISGHFTGLLLAAQTLWFLWGFVEVFMAGMSGYGGNARSSGSPTLNFSGWLGWGWLFAAAGTYLAFNFFKFSANSESVTSSPTKFLRNFIGAAEILLFAVLSVFFLPLMVITIFR